MEKYIAIMLLSAPGFIAKSIAEFLGASSPKRGEFDSVMNYFAYSVFVLVLVFFVGAIIGIYSPFHSWAYLESKFKEPVFCAEFFVLSLLCSFIVGAFWQVVGERRVIKGFNFINRVRGENEIFRDGSLFDKYFVDGKDHFLIVKSGDKEVTIGFLQGWTNPKSERMELFVAAYPEYVKWVEYAKQHEPSHPLNIIKGVYIDASNDLIVTELEYPEEWLRSPAGNPPNSTSVVV